METPAITRFPVSNLDRTPQVRRKIPSPFRRPSISIMGPDAPETRKEWRDIPACEIREGDIIPGIGVVFDVVEIVDAPAAGTGSDAQSIADQTIWQIVVKGGLNNVKTYHGAERVWAFTVRGVLREHRG